MTTSFESIQVQALMLTSKERAMLAEHLFASLDDDDSTDTVAVAWAVEIDSRLAQLDAGKVTEIPLDIAMEKIYASFK